MKAEEAKLELIIFEWMADQGYDRRACKDISPIIAKYLASLKVKEASEKGAVEFAEWLGENHWRLYDLNRDGEELVYTWYNADGNTLSSAQLYTLWKQSLPQEKDSK